MSEEVLVEIDGQRLKLSNLTKVLYPKTGTTKGEVLNYYAQIAPVLLPQLANRAVTRIRWPNGTAADSFFEKNVPAGVPGWITTATVPTTGSRAISSATELKFPVIDSLASLTYFANLASLELHVHQWRVQADQPLPPDRMVIDLDPGEPAGLAECAQVALLVRDYFAARGQACVPVTSGSKGIHLYVGLSGEQSSDEVRDWAHQIADLLAAENPLVVSQMTKAKRPGKVFFDWSQNVGSKTTIAPYSLRGRETPTVAAPRTWQEIEAAAADPLAIEQVILEQALLRVAELGDLMTCI